MSVGTAIQIQNAGSQASHRSPAAMASDRLRPLPADPEALQRLLVRIERPLIDAQVRERLIRILQFRDEGHVVHLITTIVESEGNESALIEPIVSAVHEVMSRRPEWPERGQQWLEAFDQLPLVGLLQSFRDLDVFTDKEIAGHYVVALGRRLRRRFDEMDGLMRTETHRVSGARRAIEQGLELLKHKGPHSTSLISKLAADRFGLSANECSQVMGAARIYGDKIWLVESLSRDALFELSRPTTPSTVRELVERRLRAGEKVRASNVRRLRSTVPTNLEERSSAVFRL